MTSPRDPRWHFPFESLCHHCGLHSSETNTHNICRNCAPEVYAQPEPLTDLPPQRPRRLASLKPWLWPW